MMRDGDVDQLFPDGPSAVELLDEHEANACDVMKEVVDMRSQ